MLDQTLLELLESIPCDDEDSVEEADWEAGANIEGCSHNGQYAKLFRMQAEGYR